MNSPRDMVGNAWWRMYMSQVPRHTPLAATVQPASPNAGDQERLWPVLAPKTPVFKNVVNGYGPGLRGAACHPDMASTCMSSAVGCGWPLRRRRQPDQSTSGRRLGIPRPPDTPRLHPSLGGIRPLFAFLGGMATRAASWQGSGGPPSDPDRPADRHPCFIARRTPPKGAV